MTVSHLWCNNTIIDADNLIGHEDGIYYFEYFYLNKIVFIFRPKSGHRFPGLEGIG